MNFGSLNYGVQSLIAVEAPGGPTGVDTYLRSAAASKALYAGSQFRLNGVNNPFSPNYTPGLAPRGLERINQEPRKPRMNPLDARC